ncbi:hypothetical protein Poly51_29020 [Rubripirellula tenax]|uniref:DUF5060 domain-containing protein n=1 Tax=Rubripirellula tenax TaxID=2528015 RepID=A0A5C6F7N5_9BACT|nr:DUF5060 domain-containing protein [Rubripirellula tenax]TWU56982.1 hypothetical protein Poly51_29020 [Rubripirellula tenax]
MNYSHLVRSALAATALVCFVLSPTTRAQDNALGTQDIVLEATDFSIDGTAYYLDQGKWLAIHPERNKSAKTQSAFPSASGKYHVTLEAVGESDGRATYQVAINDSQVGDFTCPISRQTFETGPQFHHMWRDIRVGEGDVVTVSSQIASADGKEFSRARVARIRFTPADAATVAAVKTLGMKAPSKTSHGEALVGPRGNDGDGSVVISGEAKQWHKVTLTLDGPFAHEGDNRPNAFTDLAFNVAFQHESGSPSYTVPGYFAADGNAAESSAEFGTMWRAHLSPDKVGRWTYTISFKQGAGAAIGDNAGTAITLFDGTHGDFQIEDSDKIGRDMRARGRLQYIGKHYLQYAGSKEFFLKVGPDAPETMLGYQDFDNTIARKSGVPLKSWKPHVGDWQSGDPAWKNGKGKGLIGAINYLAKKGCNTFSFLTYNAGGDGDNVWPFVKREDKLHYDCSKLDQWGVILDHGTAKGMHLHFKMQENEMDDNRRGHGDQAGQVPESLDGGKTGVERKLYCRELIARYGHALALNWNIGEENTQSSDEIRDMVNYIHDTDPYHHPIVLHTYPNQQDKQYTPLLGDQSKLTGVSLQNSWNQAHGRTLKWVRQSALAGRPWVCANDEQGPASDGVPADPGYQGNDGTGTQDGKTYTAHDIRKLCLWGTLMAGGGGVEYYFGYKLPENDLVCEDFRSRDTSWDYCRIAVTFFADNAIPFAEMTNADSLIGNIKNGNSKFCFAKQDEIYLVYLPNGGESSLDLSDANGAFTVEWFNPRTGGGLQQGTVGRIAGGKRETLGPPPVDQDQDWLAVVRKSAN